MTSLIRVLVVDDESLARDALQIRLREEEDIELLAGCAGGSEAVERIRAEEPDAVFLDVQMPDLNGFEVLDELEKSDSGAPLIVFATAYDEYALAAFDRHAVDYLLKPFDDERFQRALDRIRQAVRDQATREWTARLDAVLADWRSESPSSPWTRRGRILVYKHSRRILLPVREISYLEADGNYVRLHLEDGDSHLVRGPLVELDRQLDPRRFARIHRSTIVNLDCVTELIPDANGSYDVLMADGTQLKLSRTYRDRLLNRWR